MGQRMHVLFDVLLAFEAVAHGLEGTSEVAEFTSRLWRRHAFAGSHRVGIATQAPELARQPPRRDDTDQQCRTQKHQAPAQHRLLAALDERCDGLVGLGHRQHADDAAVTVADRRGDMHDGGILVGGIAAARASAVLAAQGQVHVVPARIVPAEVAAAGIEHDDAARIGDVDPVARRALVEAPDLGADVADGERTDAARELAVVDAAGEEIVGREFGQHIRGIGQSVLHGLAHARLHFLHEHVGQQPSCQRDDDEVAEQDAQADFHGPILMPWPTQASSE